jgi:predicted RNase H-like HicB family nuclease
MSTVHCTIQTDPNSGGYVGRVVNFPHFEVTGATPDEVEARLRSRVLDMHAAGTLTIECEWVRTVRIDLPGRPAGD